MGSEEFIRLQFEEYLLALLSSMKYHEELNSIVSGDSPHRSRAQLQNFNIEGDPALDFNADFLAQWQKTSNYTLFSRLTSDALLFSITEPRHPSAGGLTMDDIQRRVTQQVADLHLDERVREGREALNRHLATGQKKVSAAFNSFWSDIEAMREAQRKRNEEKASQSQRTSIDQTPGSPPPASIDSSSETSSGWFAGRQKSSVDMSQAQSSVGAYFSSWGSWASEKRREWQEKRSSSPSAQPGMTPSPSTPTLPAVTEIAESDRGRRRSMHRHSEDADGLSRSGSRRKRWSNILLRRESGDVTLHRRDESTEASTSEVTYPKSPLSQGFPAYGPEAQEKKDNETSTETAKPAETPSADADGVTAVPLSPEEGVQTDVKQDESTAHDATAGENADRPLTTTPPVKNDVHDDGAQESTGKQEVK